MSALSADEKRVFEEISYAIGDGNPHAIEDIRGVAVPKQKIPEYMSLFVQLNLFNTDGKLYTITRAGKSIFGQKRDYDFRSTGPKKRAY